jgi:hypothetical protein
MVRKPISWILEFTSKLPNDNEKIKCLQDNGVVPIKQILHYCYHPNVKWLLPEGDPPYIPSSDASETDLYKATSKLYLFIEGGHPTLNQVKREAMFIEMLQSILPEDAKLMLCVKDKKLPYEGLNANIVKKAFPDIF